MEVLFKTLLIFFTVSILDCMVPDFIVNGFATVAVSICPKLKYTSNVNKTLFNNLTNFSYFENIPKACERQGSEKEVRSEKKFTDRGNK